jgi:hypothetical protein
MLRNRPCFILRLCRNILILGDNKDGASQIADLQEVNNKNVFIGNNLRII